MTAPDDQTHAQRGTRDTGEDLPQEGESGRPAGTVDPDANPPMSDPSKQDVYGGTGALPPQDTGSAIPPYEGRTTGASPSDAGSAQVAGANVGGARGPVADDEYKSVAPEETPGGATASPADDQPAANMPETDLDDDGVAEAHQPGTRRGEDRE